jgi:tetratricopeptide (TPR) repeat protein
LGVLTSVILRDPEHYYAHYLDVHELDTSPHPEYALDSARALHRLTPGAGHLVHMGGHIFMSVGDLEMAARVNEEAAAADRELFINVLAEPAPDSRMMMTATLRHYARAVAYAGKGDRAKSLEEQRAFSAARAAIPQQTMFVFNPADKIMNVAALVLEARLATNADSAIPIWRRAVEAQDALLYDDPPDWYYWIRQSLGAALLRSGRAADAETVFREGLRRSPRNPRLLFGLWKCLDAQGRSSDAGWVQREFAASWRGGDPASSLHIENF